MRTSSSTTTFWWRSRLCIETPIAVGLGNDVPVQPARIVEFEERRVALLGGERVEQADHSDEQFLDRLGIFVGRSGRTFRGRHRASSLIMKRL